MASYYKHLNVFAALPAAVKGRADVEQLATRAEALLVRRFTISGARRVRRLRRRRYTGVGSGYTANGAPWISTDGLRAVLLLYYEPDAAAVDDTDADAAAFLEAMRLTLVDLVTHLATQQDEEGNDRSSIESERRGQRAVTYATTGARAARNSDFPRGIGLHLEPFSLRPRVFSA